MNRTKIAIAAVSGAAAALTAAALLLPTASAQTPDARADASQATLTRAQAVTIAEVMGNGRATRVRYDGGAEQPVYKVTVVAPGEAPLKLDIAAAGGRIVASERKHGRERDHDEDRRHRRNDDRAR